MWSHTPTSGNILTQYRHPREQYDTLGQHFRAFPSPGSTAADPSVSRMRLFAHETTSEDPSVSRSRRLAHETTLADLSVSRTRRLAHETTLEDPSVSRTRYFAHETTSEDPFVSRTRRSAHETTLADLFVSRTRRLAHETAAKDTRGNRGAFSASYGNSMETLRALYGRSSMPPRFDQSQWDS